MEGRGKMFLLPHAREEEVRWWSGYVGKDGQSCHNHHHSTFTAPNYLNKNNKEVDKGETREDGKLNKVATHGFPP